MTGFSPNWYRSHVRYLPEPRVWTDREAKRIRDHIINVAALVDLFVTEVNPAPVPENALRCYGERLVYQVEPYRWTRPYEGDNQQTYVRRHLNSIKAMGLRPKLPELEVA